MPGYLSEQLISEIRAKFATIESRVNQIMLSVHRHRFKNERAREYYQHGFLRRVGTLQRCIQNIFELIPPETTEVPPRTTLYDGQIQAQSFIANVFGSVDNLAWVFVYEHGLDAVMPRKHVGLRKDNADVRSHLSADSQERLREMDGWFDYITEYRDALAHRIPLYIPPGSVRPHDVENYNDLMTRMTDALNGLQPYEYERLAEEQRRLLVFQPMITHSIKETTGHFVFHVQMLADLLTVEELGQLILNELKAPR
ncbi:MAG: hypothetical protein WB495_26010 [Xanthobacteraceae bacterium]